MYTLVSKFRKTLQFNFHNKEKKIEEERDIDARLTLKSYIRSLTSNLDKIRSTRDVLTNRLIRNNIRGNEF